MYKTCIIEESPNRTGVLVMQVTAGGEKTCLKIQSWHINYKYNEFCPIICLCCAFLTETYTNCLGQILCKDCNLSFVIVSVSNAVRASSLIDLCII